MRATLPMTSRARPVRPWVPMTIRSVLVAAALAQDLGRRVPLEPFRLRLQAGSVERLGHLEGELVVVPAGGLGGLHEDRHQLGRAGLRKAGPPRHLDVGDAHHPDRRAARRPARHSSRSAARRRARRAVPGQEDPLDRCATGDEHGRGRVIDELRGDRAEQHGFDPAVAPAADDDEIGLHRSRPLDDDRGRAPAEDGRLDVEAGPDAAGRGRRRRPPRPPPGSAPRGGSTSTMARTGHGPPYRPSPDWTACATTISVPAGQAMPPTRSTASDADGEPSMATRTRIGADSAAASAPVTRHLDWRPPRGAARQRRPGGGAVRSAGDR